MTLRDIAHSLFAEAIATQSPSSIVYESSKKYDTYFDDATRIFPVAVGKASVEMMSGLLDYLNENYPSKIYKKPIVVSNPQEMISTHDFTHIVSSHPTPDDSSLYASRVVLDYIDQSSESDLAIFLISGGGSSLLSLPADGISLDDKIKLTQLLLASGCNINDINTVRKHVSKIKGGRLNSAALPSRSISLLISDVINDDLSSIASGPTVADETTFHDAINVLNKYDIFEKSPESIQNHLKKGVDNSAMETPKEFDNNIIEIISSNIVFRKTLADLAEAKNFNVVSLEETFEGLAIDDAERLYDKVTNINKPNTIIISGGETLVNLTGNGLGGRNQEFALSFLRKYVKENSKRELCLYSVGTDGIDGPTDAAGAIVDSDTIREYQSSDLNLESFLSNNDSYNFFRKLNSLIKTGATGTNIADIQITVIK
tara:strand:+ start:45 stop:1331 length:1287 start_codon:yes stop_codon:yes gene_type:complete